ncbi:acetoin utilization protein AcuC [Actinotalea sp. BY-33]|uniref:Acetoin utilization protein AcuC n=1 Tax=Actinotalea soli TaxID=2819234 RepID=A0A939LT59_9CELL|nr:acetoin utilization protein AcuC [Actinotalea soli]MBO1753423.1 acetoin utilization protein AcuC [Actinotalea soli]
MTSPGPHRTRLVWSTEMLGYDFGDGHPMAPLRLDLTMRLVEDLGLTTLPGVELVGAAPAPDALLETAHAPGYVAAVRAASLHGKLDLVHGLGTSDDPVFPGMHEAAARVVTGSVEAALAVWQARADHAVNLTGGMHHAMVDHASGFCVYNDAVAAIRAVLEAGAERVAYVDVDAHHGDGVERAFWDDPRVLTISVHESGHTLFPGTGHPTDVGGPHARGRAVNVALPSGTTGTPWLRAVAAVVEPLVRSFRPELIVSQHGCDAHGSDPLTNLAVSVDAQRRAMGMVHDLAHEVSQGRWVALGGGGYAVVEVVPRAWAHLVGVATHHPVDPATPVPEAWLEHVATVLGAAGPVTMGDEDLVLPRLWSEGYDPGDLVDRIIMATRQATFHHHDLDALYD